MEVAVSARILSFPRMCVCCCGIANHSLEIASTKRTGVRIVREQTRWWEVPYCQRCFDHIRAAEQMRNFKTIVPHWPFLLWFASISVGFMVLLALAKMPTVVAIIMSVIWLVMVTLFIYTLHKPIAKYHRHLIDKRETKKAELRNDYKDLLKKGCAVGNDYAAEYAGWNGTVHIFYFYNKEYARAFCIANARKVLG